MADISAWSPVDESNTAAPPNGWPENMQVSGVNNSARAMMGAIRRNYDTVTAQFAALPGQFLPFTGGTISGNLSVVGTITGNAINSNGNIGAAGALTVSSNITAGGQVSGNVVAGNLVNGTSINAVQYKLSGIDFAVLDPSATFTAIYGPGFQSITMYVSGVNYYDNNQHYLRSSGGGTTYFIANAGGTYNQNGTWGTISDDRLKTNVAEYSVGLEALRKLQPRSFRYKAGPFRSDKTIYGLMASEVKPVVPEMVGEIDLEKNGKVQTLSPGHLVYVLLNACKELANRIETLERKV